MTFRGNHVDELISASLTGELTDAERLELDAHLVRCETCRATLAAFTAERRILSGLPLADPPRDLSARVRTGIESGRSGSSWWRRPGGLIAVGASLATVAAAVLAVVVIGNLDLGGVGQQSGSPVASVSFEPGPSAVETSPPTEAPTPVPAFALGPGDLGYLSLTGAPFEESRLSFVNDATGASIDLGSVSGPPIAASLSPDSQWLGYITQKGESGVNEVWALHLTDGEVIALGCSHAPAFGGFGDRLTWSPNSLTLAYTLTAVDLGPESGCPVNDGEPETTEPWLFDTTGNYSPERVTRVGPDSYAAQLIGDYVTLIESQAGALVSTTVACWFCDSAPEQVIEGVFMPLYSPDGNRALFWIGGVMASSGDGWEFTSGGMPQLSRDFRSSGSTSPWFGSQLFTDLNAGGEAFAFGDFAWGPDSDLIAFWNGAWTGPPQSADGSYPSQRAVYVGRISDGLLTQASRLPLDLAAGGWIVDVAFSPDGQSVAVTVGLSSAGIGDPPSAYLQVVPLDGSEPRTIGGGVEPPPWNGPAVYGY